MPFLRTCSSVRRACLLVFATAALAIAQTPITYTLQFNADEGGEIPASQTILLATKGNSCAARTADLAVDAKPGPSWLSVSPSVCTTPTLLRVTVDPAGLKPGT